MRWGSFLLVAALLMAQEFEPRVEFGAERSRGLGWADYDLDGDLDLGLTNIGWDPVYRNDGPAGFSAVDSLAPDTSFGIAWADYDNDGWPDLALATRGRVVIYKNLEGSFLDSLVLPVSGARGLGWADYDKDGWVDLAVAVWGRPNRLYRNSEGRSFSLVVGAFGSAADSSMGLAWADYDQDGDPDLSVANFMGPNKLYRNDQGSFVELTLFGLAEEPSMGLAWADYDNDGWLDLALTNLGEPNRLYRNNQHGSFTEVVGAFGGAADSSRGLSWGDYDLDGWPDLVIANYGGPNKLYHNNGDNTFTELLPFGMEPDSSYGVARGDFDSDGDLDLAVARDGDNRLYRNMVDGGQYLIIRGEGRGEGYTNRDGVGARVLIYVQDSLVGFQVWASGSGFCSMDALDLVFGVADSCDVEVRWPSGIVDWVKGVGPPQELLIYEDQSPPQDPDSVWSESHEIGGWSSSPVIEMRWSGASDPEGSGVRGYSWAFDPDSLFLPDTLMDGPDTTAQSPPLTSGAWFFHLRCVDSVGNWSAGVHRGPYLLDLEAPAPPESLYANEQLARSKWTNDSLFTIRWVESPVPTSLRDTSGIRAGLYKLGDEPSDNYDTTGTTTQNPFELYWSREGITPLYLWLQDSSGNLDYRNNARVDLRYDSTPPRPPGLVSPTAGVSINQERPWFVWSGVEAGLSGVMDYKIEVATDSFFDPSEWEGVATDTTCRAGVPLPEGRLFWRAQTQDSAGNHSEWSAVDSFLVDLTPPRVLTTNPHNEATDVPLSANILVAFSEPMDSTTIKPETTFTVTGNLPPPTTYSGRIYRVGGNYIFDPDSLFRPRDGIICRLTTGIRDLAGNGLQEDYAWGFTAGEKSDTIGPIVSNFKVWPDTTRGADTLFLQALISDVGLGDQPIQRAEYFIDKEPHIVGSGHPMKGEFGSGPVITVYDTIIIDTTWKLGPHKFYLHGQDLSNNWGPYDSVEVWVTGEDTIPPELSLVIVPKDLCPGDTLSIQARSDKKLLEWRSWVTGPDGTEYPVDAQTGDSSNFSGRFPVIGLALGRAAVSFFGMDSSGNSSSAVDSFSVRMGEHLLPRDQVYPWPNPVRDGRAHFRYTLTANGNVGLMIYTLDGRQVLTRYHLWARGGVSGEFIVDVSSLPNDLYFFKLRAETLDGRVVEEVVKKFVVLR